MSAEGFLQQDGFQDAVKAVLQDALYLPQSFLDYMVQYQALNGLPVPVSQITGFVQYTAVATTITTEESLSTTGFTDLTTVGPQLTALPDGRYLILFGAAALSITAGNQILMSIQPNATSAVDADACVSAAGTVQSISRAVTKTLQNNGNNSLTCKYRSTTNGQSADFKNRWLVALKFGNAN